MADQSDTDDTEIEDGASPVDDVHEEAMERFDSVIVAVQEERALALEDRRFVSIAGAQWEGIWGEQFENSIMVEVNKTAQGVEKIEGDYRANRMIVNFRGVGDGTSEETAETLNGMYRADLYVSEGQQALDNAFTEAVQGGMGAWRLTNVPYDPFDPDDERQRVATTMIGDADQCVFWDPNSRLQNKSDAKWCIVVTAMARAAYVSEYGADKCTEWPQGINKWHYDWYTPDVVRVAEYYVVELKAEKRLTLENRATNEIRKEWAGKFDATELQTLEIEGWRVQRTRMIKRKRVKKYVLSGAEILKPGKYIAGTEIPIIMVYGKRWWIDNMERSRGHVRLAKDPQRIYNANASKLVEISATAATERPIFDPEQVQGFEDEWANANINKAPFARARALRNEDGSVAVAGPIGTITPPVLPPVTAALMQIASADIMEITASDDGAAMTQSNVSAEAMDIAAQRTDAKSQLYMSNMKDAVQWNGKVWKSMTCDLVEEGDEVQTMADEEKPSFGTAKIAEPYTDQNGRYSIRNDIAAGKYEVIADVTEATATRRDKTVKNCFNGVQMVAPFNPQLANALALTGFMNMDGEGIQDLKDWARKQALDMGLVKPTAEEQQQAEAAAQAQQPDPQAQFLLAAAEEKKANAAKTIAGVDQTKADTALKVVQAAKTQSEIGQGEQNHKMGMMDRLKEGAKSFFSPKPNSGKPNGGPEVRQ